MARKSTKTEEVVEEINAVEQESVLDAPVSEVPETAEVDLGKGETLTEVVEDLAETIKETLEEKEEQDEEPVVEESVETPDVENVEDTAAKVEQETFKEDKPSATRIFIPSDFVPCKRTVTQKWIGKE